MNRVIANTLLLTGVIGFCGCGKSVQEQEPVDATYTRQRQHFFSIEPIKGPSSPPARVQVQGVLMEAAAPDHVITLEVVSDGTIGLYFSSGGGILGAGQQEGPRKAAEVLLSFVPDFIRYAEPAIGHPFPQKEHVRFYFVTSNGILTYEAREVALESNKDRMAPVYHKAQDVIEQIQVSFENRKAAKQ